jgi:hypothetical protein
MAVPYIRRRNQDASQNDFRILKFSPSKISLYTVFMRHTLTYIQIQIQIEYYHMRILFVTIFLP